jgi:hypothetical protein
MARQKMTAAQRIDSLVERAKYHHTVSTKIAGSKVECIRRWYAPMRNRTYFYVDGQRISRFDLLAWLDEALS